MERSQILEAMAGLKLYGMRGAYDAIVATAVKRQHEPQRVVGDLLEAEINEKKARSIKYQMTIARLPLAKDIDDFDFDAAAVNETLVRDLAGGGFLEQQRNVVLVGGTGTGKTPRRYRHRARLHPPRRPRPLLQRRRSGQQARGRDPRRPPGPHCRSSHPPRLRRPGRARLPALRSIRWPAALPPDQPPLRAHLSDRHDQPRVRGMAKRLRRRQDDHRAPRPAHSPLRHR